MNKYFVIILFLIFTSCIKDVKKPTSVDLETKNKAGHITLIFKNAPKARFISLAEDEFFGGRQYFDKIAYINDSNGIKQYIEPVKRGLIDTITIPTNAKQIEVNFYQKRLIEKSFLFFNGDSIVVSYNQNYTPNIKILNRDHSKFDYTHESIENGVFELTPEEKYFKYLPYPSQKLSTNELQKFWAFERKKNGKLLINSLNTKKSKLDSLLNLNLISTSMYKYYTNKMYYVYYSFLVKEKLFHTDTILQSSKLDKSQTKIGELKFKGVKSIDYDTVFNNKKLGIEYSFYKDFLETYIFYYYEQKTTKKIYKFKNFGGTIYEYDVVFDSISQSKLFSNKVKEYLLYKDMIKIAEQLPTETINSYYKKFKKDVENELYIDLIESNYKLSKSVNNKLEMVTIENKKHYLEDIINENKGKILYVNFWASWCKPCIDVLKDYKSLMADYKNRDVVFVNISVEKNYETWKKSMNKYNFLTNSFFMKNYYTSKIVKDNYVQFVPRYLLFNKEGVLVNNNAPKPNTKEIRNLFNSLN